MKEMATKDYTKSYITTALFQLMEVKPYSEITISEIVKKAGVGRVTYYRNFKSKEDIIIQYFDIKKDEFKDRRRYDISEKDRHLSIIMDVFENFKEHKEIMKLITKAHIDFIYLDYLNKNMVENFKDNFQNSNKYTPYIYAGALYNISMQWLKNDCQESIKDISLVMYDSVFPNNIKTPIN